MADSTSAPFLSKPKFSYDSEIPQPKNHLPSLGSTIELCLEEFTLFQFLQALLVSFAWIFDAQQLFVTVFTDAQPTRIPSSPVSHGGSYSSIISEWHLNPDDPILTGLLLLHRLPPRRACPIHTR
ncbi:hypothetical protein QN277_002302 [Acacia crassicarpa]|uniref:Uncharacterized protein n=1 Tax=Acacia crassicarpa TaxID=499986 RepID=A0AAE1N907_9FABA|nr:hypothetical protein QN277_002302 [Acacia crassicarpa]